jgi:hypothetical protein
MGSVVCMPRRIADSPITTAVITTYNRLGRIQSVRELIVHITLNGCGVRDVLRATVQHWTGLKRVRLIYRTSLRGAIEETTIRDKPKEENERFIPQFSTPNLSARSDSPLRLLYLSNQMSRRGLCGVLPAENYTDVV